MHVEQEPMQLIRQAMAQHIKEVAQELLYWMEELSKLDNEKGEKEAGHPAHQAANT